MSQLKSFSIQLHAITQCKCKLIFVIKKQYKITYLMDYSLIHQSLLPKTVTYRKNSQCTSISIIPFLSIHFHDTFTKKSSISSCPNIHA